MEKCWPINVGEWLFLSRRIEDFAEVDVIYVFVRLGVLPELGHMVLH